MIRHLLPLLVILVLVSCTKPRPIGGGSSDPKQSLAPVIADASCPLIVDSGKALGPFRIGDTRDTMSKRGLFSQVPRNPRGNEILTQQPLQVILCKGKVVDIYVLNLHRAPDCLYYRGKSVPVLTKWEDLPGIFKGCKKSQSTDGSEVFECQGGTVLEKNKYGQIRIHATRGWNKPC